MYLDVGLGHRLDDQRASVVLNEIERHGAKGRIPDVPAQLGIDLLDGRAKRFLERLLGRVPRSSAAHELSEGPWPGF